VDRYGKVSIMNVSNIGRKSASAGPARPPWIIASSATTPLDTLIANVFCQLATIKNSGAEAFQKYGATLSADDDAVIQFIAEYAHEKSSGAA